MEKHTRFQFINSHLRPLTGMSLSEQEYYLTEPATAVNKAMAETAPESNEGSMHILMPALICSLCFSIRGHESSGSRAC